MRFFLPESSSFWCPCTMFISKPFHIQLCANRLSYPRYIAESKTLPSQSSPISTTFDFIFHLLVSLSSIFSLLLYSVRPNVTIEADTNTTLKSHFLIVNMFDCITFFVWEPSTNFWTIKFHFSACCWHALHFFCEPVYLLNSTVACTQGKREGTRVLQFWERLNGFTLYLCEWDW